jgi:predicted DNA-binding WGR domain protein
MVRRMATRRAQSPAFEDVHRLERLEGPSTLFYEVSRRDKWVKVESGRVGLPGQTRMREYPTPAAAGVAMERLVEDRLKEGWLEPAQLAAAIEAAAKKAAEAQKPKKPTRPRAGTGAKVPKRAPKKKKR